MAPLALIVVWAGYTAMTWGIAKWKWANDPTATQLTLSDLTLPSHRTTYINAMEAYAAGGTTSFVNTPANDKAALGQAAADVAYYCNGTNPPAGTTPTTGLTCATAKTRLANVTSVTSGTPSAPAGATNAPRYKQWLSDLGL
ncbi:MAG TPA: hypothetical protein VN799_00070 [Acidimicrobiales bacterium]|nr:hypothetical protein [Acidimicrobiales bacterium]